MMLKLLDRLTSLFLALVVVALAWVIVAAKAPETVRWAELEVEVIVILVVLAATLLLVSVVALLHTRSSSKPDPPSR
jgi:hypothetical protein